MISITATSISFIYTVLLMIVFFSKERLKNNENKIFSYMLIVNVFGIFLDILSGILYMNNYDINSLLYIYLTKFIIIYYIIWDFLMLYYVIIISSTKFNNLIKKIIKVTLSIMIFIAIISPLKITINNNNPYPSSFSLNVLYIITFILISTIVVIFIKNFKKLQSKKYIPLFLYLFFGFIMFIIQNITGILLLTATFSFITNLMYFTIENPDIKMIAQLNEAKAQAEKANNAKSEFLSNMSHEIRTPLNAIVGFSQALMEEDINDNAKEEVKDIVSASQSLLEIVNGILDISKIEANKLEIVNTEYNFNNVLKDLVSLTKARLGDKPLEFRTNFDSTIPAVLYGDQVRIKQVILNILTNAVKYTKQGYIEFKVSSVRKDDVCRLIISVEDSGIGIEEDKIDKLFSKFERLDIQKNNTIEGTGLGLAITKKLVELMNGKIVVQSVYGKGSRFTVALDQRIISDEPITIEKEEVKEEIKDCTGKKVLIVDDNSLNLKVAARLLEKYKVDIETSSNGFDVIDMIKNGKTYDLVLMDDMMPKISGVETFKKLKEIEGYNIPTIALTANAIEGMKEKYLSIGFNGYLSKPIDKNELNNIINEFLK